MARKKRGVRKRNKRFELTPLNLIVLFFALSFVMQTCSPSIPDNGGDLPPFPEAPPGASIVGNYITGFQTATTSPQPIMVPDINIIQEGANVLFSYSLQNMEATWADGYINGQSIGPVVTSDDPRNSQSWKVGSPDFEIHGSFSLENLGLPPGTYEFQILSYTRAGNTWDISSYNIHTGKIIVNEEDFFAGLPDMNGDTSEPIGEETMAPEEDVDVTLAGPDDEFVIEGLNIGPYGIEPLFGPGVGSDEFVIEGLMSAGPNDDIYIIEGLMSAGPNDDIYIIEGLMSAFNSCTGNIIDCANYLYSLGYDVGIILVDGVPKVITITQKTGYKNPGFIIPIHYETKQIVGGYSSDAEYQYLSAGPNDDIYIIED